jgi:heme a synthase
VSQLHAIAPGRVTRAARDPLVVRPTGVVGQVPYSIDLPMALVLLHVLITAYTARLAWSVRGLASELPLEHAAAEAESVKG